MLRKNLEFQGIVLCGGYGTRMPELSDDIPKALLPVGNVPIFWYALNIFQNNNIHDILLLTNERAFARITQLLDDELLPPLPDLNIEVINTGAHGRDWGTVQALKHVQEKIKNDFIVISGDIVSDLNLDMMLEQHRAEDATMTVLLAENALTTNPPGPKRIHGKCRDFTIIPSERDPPKLLYLVAEEDFEDMPPKGDLFLRNRNVRLTSRYKNCSIFIMKKGLLNVIRSLDDSYTSLNTDFIPYMLEMQNAPRDALITEMIFGKIQDDDDAESDSDDEYCRDRSRRIRCYAYIAKIPQLSIIAHCNNAGSYFAINKAVAHNPKLFFSQEMLPELNLGMHYNGVDTYSTIFKGVEIGTNVRISGSNIMKGVVIGNGSQIHNSIIMDGAIIGENCHINNSIICCKQSILDGERVSNAIKRTMQTMDLD